MTNTSTNAASDTEEIELHPEPSTTNEDRINHWVDYTVASEIERGKNLRRKKPAPYQRKDGRPKIVNLTNSSKRHRRQTNKAYNNTSPRCGCSYWSSEAFSNSVVPSSTHSQKNSIKIRIKADNQTKCTIRTAQLAAPSKRHCLDTWRNKSYLLPTFMVDRLKQHVMDQLPIVQISEAIDSFQRRKPRSTKNMTNKLQVQTSQRFVETTALCLMFAQKIVLILSRPLNITLNSDLKNLARVVGDDIAQITNFKKRINKAFPIDTDPEQYRSIHTDVTYKVTAWIAHILDDLNYKLLEDDLRDLEEEEGPVLDFLDDVVDKVLDICAPEPSITYIKKKSDYSDSSNVDTNEDETLQNADDKLTDTEYELTDTEHFRNEISNIISNIGKETDSITLTDKEYFEKEILNTVSYLFKDDEIEGEGEYLHRGDNLTDRQHFENEIYNIISIVCKGEIENKNNERVPDEDKENSEIEGSENSEDSDNGSKKVMFSISDMVIINKITGNTMSDLAKHDNIRANEHKQRNIFFAEPNLHLLSDADEVWPKAPVNNVANPLKPSASVTKSILSLGNIWERDEKYITSSQTDGSITVLKNLDRDFQDKEVLKSVSSLVRLLHGGQKYGAIDKLNLLTFESRNEMTIAIVSLMHVLKNYENVTPENANVTIVEKLKLLNVELPDKDVKYLETLLNILRNDEMLLSSSDSYAYIAEKLILCMDLQGEDILPAHTKVTMAIISLINILQNDENLIPDEVNAAITEKFTLVDTELPNEKATKSIGKLFKILQGEKQHLPSLDATAQISEILVLLNVDLQVEKAIKSIAKLVKNIQSDKKDLPINTIMTKTMISILNILREDLRLKLAKGGNLQEIIDTQKLLDIIDAFLAATRNTQRQTDIGKPLDEIVVTETMATRFDSKLIDNNISVQASLDTEAINIVEMARITADAIEHIMQPGKEWKVHLKTAPSWIIQTNAHGEPSEDQAQAVILTKSDVRKWCKNLDKGFKNLEIWSGWLRSTCEQTTSLLSKRNTCVCFNNKSTKNWIKLKNNIAKDAALWKKMNKQTHDTFKTFQKYYGSTKVVSIKHNVKCVCKNKS